MNQDAFVDYYEDLQVSPNADMETIERVYRMLAKRYHPDNNASGNAAKFEIITQAYHVLADVEKRAKYDATYSDQRDQQFRLLSDVNSSDRFEEDRRMRQAILSALYVERRRSPDNAGVGIWRLEQMLGSPEQLLEFHIWYLKEKEWILRTDTGGYAITALGVDAVEGEDLLINRDRLLTDNRHHSQDEEIVDLVENRNSN